MMPCADKRNRRPLEGFHVQANHLRNAGCIYDAATGVAIAVGIYTEVKL